MADIRAFFTEYLPAKLAKNPAIAADINNVYQFNLGDAGSWIVDLAGGKAEVVEGTHAAPGCIVTAASSDFAKLLDSPAAAMTLFMTGKLKVSNMSLGMALQKLLG